jgi:hypothetical protein
LEFLVVNENLIFYGGMLVIALIGGTGIYESIKEKTFMKYPSRMFIKLEDSIKIQMLAE